MLTHENLQQLTEELQQIKYEAIKSEKATNQQISIQESSGELSMYDNHPADMGTALFDREKDRALNEHAESKIRKIEMALQAIKDGQYGKCQICDKDIPFERLLIVPYTTYCIEHASAVEQSVDEDAALNEVENPFKSTRNPHAIDYENSFEAVAEFGTSDSPSDFVDPARTSYMDDNLDDFDIDQVIEKSITDQSENRPD